MTGSNAGRFEGQVVIVTGAAGGIGRAIARRLAGESATTVVADVDGEGADSTVATITDAGGRAEAITVDLSVREQRARLVPEVVARHGGVDVLVNNAATLGPQRHVLDLDDDAWDTVIATNLTATALLSRDAARSMAARNGGVIVNFSSLHAQLPLPQRVAYAASKGGIAALTLALAVELAPSRIRVNAVIPGMITSPTLDDSIADAGGRDAEVPTLVGRFGTPDEVASTVAYLASDEAAYVTGAIWRVDGGRGISRKPDPLFQPGEVRNPDTGAAHR